MRIVFDILGSTERSGGMRLHSTEMIRAWTRCWPQDEVTIVGPAWAAAEFSAVANVRVWPNESAVSRSFGQLFVSWQVARRQRAHALVSLSPVVSPFFRGMTVCFQHDWRHKLNPREFPLVQRVYRRLWEFSARCATTNACISRKAIEETSRFVPSSRNVLIENGWDHARSWPAPGDSERDGHLVTFGHHNNKRPELAIAALALMKQERGVAPTLVVLGARGSFAAELYEIARKAGVENSVRFPGFVSDEEYQKIMSTSAAVVMPSTDEGFGLPVAEALFLGIPAVVTSDSGMPEIFGAAVTSSPPVPGALARAISAALEETNARPSLQITTWDAAAEKLRRVTGRTAD